MKKFLSIILVFAMLSSMVVINVSAQEASKWDGVSVSSTLFGSGTENNPYLIQSASDLKLFANMVNGGAEYDAEKVNTFAGQYVKQTVDIDLGNHPWTPIGYTESATFQGVYNGDGHEVKGLAVIGAPKDRNGFFGAIGEPSVKDGQTPPSALSADCGVANLTLTGTLSLASSETFDAGVGGLVGYINNSNYTGNSKVYITNVTLNMQLTACGFSTGGCFGGLAGEAYSTVFENVVNYGTVSVTADRNVDNATGGLVGRIANCEFIGCVNNGDVYYTTALFEGGKVARVGGLAGFYYKNGTDQYATFTSCINNGNVIAKSTNATPSLTHCGGVLGSIYTDQDKVAYGSTSSLWHNFNLTFKNCANDGAVRINFTQVTNTGSTQGTAGGILGSGYSGNGLAHWNGGGFHFENCVNTGPVDFLNYNQAAGIAGNVYTDWYNTYDIEFVRCITAAREGDFAIVWGHAITNFHSGTSTNIHLTCTYTQMMNMMYMNDNARKCYDSDTESANALLDWNRSLLAPSIIDINGMPTGANVAILRGVKNEAAELPYEVPKTMVVVDKNGNNVTNITESGVYTVKLALVSITPYVTDEFALAYNVAFERGFFTNAANINFALGKNTDSMLLRYCLSDFHKVSTYGTLEAQSAKFTFKHILPQQFAMSVKMNITDGEKTVFSYDYSLMTYAMNSLGKTAEKLGMSEAKKAAFDTLLVDMLKYVAVAQSLVGETKVFATDRLSEQQLACASTFSTEGLENVKSVTDEVENELIKWTAATLVFDQAVTVRLKFTCDNISYIQGCKFLVSISDHSSTNYQVSELLVEGDGYYYIDIKGFSPVLYGNTIWVRLAYGAESKSETVAYSINSYILNKHTDATYGELVRALACYSSSAQKYLSIEN